MEATEQKTSFLPDLTLRMRSSRISERIGNARLSITAVKAVLSYSTN
jgi:hypothetical protein